MTPPSGRTAVERPPLLATAVLVGLLMAVLVVLVSAAGTTSTAGRVGGDLPEFVGAGRLVAAGDGGALYDPDAQIAAQEGLWPTGDEGAVLFGYPAFVAAPYAVLDMVGIGLSGTYVMVTTLMAAAAVGAFFLARRSLHWLRGREWVAPLAFALSFLPSFVAVTGGQTTAVVALLVATTWWCLGQDRVTAAGVAAGLMLLKPQYGLAVLALLVVARRPRAVASFAATGAVLWVASAMTAGAGWTARWIVLLRDFAAVDGGANSHNEISWTGLAQALLGHGSSAAAILGALASLATITVLLACLHRRRRLDGPTLAVCVTSVLLAVPHALYYDGALMLFAVAAILPGLAAAHRTALLAGVWLLGAAHPLSGLIGFEPTAIALIVVWALSVRAAGRSPERIPAHPGSRVTAPA
jgi:hypothetical protein